MSEKFLIGEMPDGFTKDKGLLVNWTEAPTVQLSVRRRTQYVFQTDILLPDTFRLDPDDDKFVTLFLLMNYTKTDKQAHELVIDILF